MPMIARCFSRVKYGVLAFFRVIFVAGSLRGSCPLRISWASLRWAFLVLEVSPIMFSSPLLSN